MELDLIDMDFFLILLVELVEIFGVDTSSSTKTDNNRKYISILGAGPTQGLEHTLSTEKNVFN